MVQKKKNPKNQTKIKKYITKDNIFYFVLLLIDISIIIYSARHNYANYVTINRKKVFIGKTKNILFGRNYIVLITTLFIYVYTLLSNKILLHKENKKEYIIKYGLLLLLLNITLFYIFTKRIY